jgi:CheY-like chemotaxis protein/two-component sensor histidine kinase
MEAIGTLAGGIAHDINNILGIILGHAELSLDEPFLPGPVRRNLGVIAKACLRAKDVVKQLLRFNRGMEGELKPVRLASVVEDFTGFIRATIPNSIDIRLEIDDRQTAVRADSTQIQQVLLNLCTNAAQAIPEKSGVLIVEMKSVMLENEEIGELPAGRYIRLSVQDDGCGIPTPAIDRVFDPYFTTKDLGKHSGMGLSVVHGVVKNHGGQVTVESAEGRGTRVSVYLPVTNEAVAEIPKNQKPQTTPPGGDETILVVDDEKPLTSLARQILERLGYRVETLNDPRAAFELLQKNPDRFDLVITDMAMPHMTGDRLAAEIRSIRPEMPIILCTGYSERMNKNNTQPGGIGGYLEKPLDRVQLAETIRSVLDGRPPASPPPH